MLIGGSPCLMLLLPQSRDRNANPANIWVRDQMEHKLQKPHRKMTERGKSEREIGLQTVLYPQRPALALIWHHMSLQSLFMSPDSNGLFPSRLSNNHTFLSRVWSSGCVAYIKTLTYMYVPSDPDVNHWRNLH